MYVKIAYTKKRTKIYYHKIFGDNGLSLFILACIAGAAPFAYFQMKRTNYLCNDTTSNIVIATVLLGIKPIGIALASDGRKAYITNYVSNAVSIIDTATNTC